MRHLSTLAVAIVVGACACGLTTRQQAAVQTFSAATMDFTTLASSEFVKTRTDLLQMNALRLQLNDRALDPTRMDAPFTVDRVKVRIDALTALQRYALLLRTLVTTSQEAELQRASDSFITSVRSVQGVTLSDERAAAISAAVQRVGGLLVEYLRARAVREVVMGADGAVLQLASLVRRDFDPEGDDWSLGYDLVVTALEGAAEVAARRDGTRDAAAITEARILARRNRDRVVVIAGEVTGAADGIARAEINLREAVQSRDVNTADIERFANQVQDFVTIYTILR